MVDGKLVFMLRVGFIGIMSFSYLLDDGQGGMVMGFVELIVVVQFVLYVSSFQVIDIGFWLCFDKVVDVSLVQLYGIGVLVLDFSLMFGIMVVNGSIVFDVDGQGFSFVKVGGVFVVGEYMLKLNVGVDGFVSFGGLWLDGDGDGVMGDNYVKVFSVVVLMVFIVLVEDFVCVFGQVVSYDLVVGGFVFSVQNVSGLSYLSFDLCYDLVLFNV